MNHVTVDGVCYDAKQDNKPFITLSLSKEAAQALLDMCSVTGGDPKNSDRKYSEAVFNAITVKGLTCNGGSAFLITNNALWFKDYN